MNNFKNVFTLICEFYFTSCALKFERIIYLDIGEHVSLVSWRRPDLRKLKPELLPYDQLFKEYC